MRLSICARQLAQTSAEPRQVALGRLEAQLRLVPAAVQPGDAGRILQDAAALLGLGVDDLADLALAHEGRRARAGRGVLEQDLDVARARLAAVDAVGRARLALDAARHLQHVAVVELGRAPCAAALSMKIVTSAMLRAGRVVVPEKITSSMAAARMDL